MRGIRSPATGRRYPLRWICEAWQVPRSSVYAAPNRGQGRIRGGTPSDRGPGRPLPQALGGAEVSPHPPRRGPRSRISDAELLAAIRDELAGSPFTGEGHKKVQARLRRRTPPIRVSRSRVLRVMRAAQLLAPHRVRRTHGDPAHPGTIVTAGPNQRWGTDGTTILTGREGRVWLFLTVEHWNDEILGWHVTKRGDRFAALQAVQAAVQTVAGHVEPEAVRGVELRMDHGSQYTSRDFLAGIRYWGMSPSFAFVEEPECNGVAERLIGLVREQVLAGRVFQDADAVRAAVAAFVPRFNAEWLLARHGYRSPHEVRRSLRQEAA